MQYIYDNTMPGSDMRKLMLQRFTMGLFKGKLHNPVTAVWREVMNETPDLGFDIMNELASYNLALPSRLAPSACRWHRHDESLLCVVPAELGCGILQMDF